MLLGDLFTYVLENPGSLIVTVVLVGVAFYILFFLGGDTIVFFRRKKYKNAPKDTKKTEQTIRRFASAKGYKVLTDVTVPYRNSTPSFDIILVGVFGVLGVNTCGLGGEIYGSAKEDEWLQIFEGERTHFPNPLDENTKNMGALRSALSENGIKIKGSESLLVFTQKQVKVNVATNLPYAYVDGLRSTLDQAKFAADNKVDIDSVCAMLEKLSASAKNNGE